jgi:hypothetical protein
MTRIFETPIDLRGFELRNAAAANLSGAPSGPTVGQIYFDTTLNRLAVWDGTAWRVWADRANTLWDGSTDHAVSDLVNRANATGTQTRATISDLFTATLDEFTAPAGNVGMNGHKLTGMAAASAAGDAVEYAQFEAALATGVVHKLTAVAPSATTGAFTVTPGTPCTVVWTHGLGNSAADLVCRYYTSPGSGNTQGARVELDDVATDPNNLTITFPTTPAANQYYLSVTG